MTLPRQKMESHHESVYALYAPFRKIAKLTCLPRILASPSKKKFYTYLFCISLLYGYMVEKAFYDFDDDYSSRVPNSITVLLDRLVLWTSAGLLLYMLGSSFNYQRKLKRIQALIDDFDLCFKKNANVNFSSKKKSVRTSNILVAMFAITNIYYVCKALFLTVYTRKIKWLFVAEVISKFVITFKLTRTCVIANVIYWRFCFLNKYVKSLCVTQSVVPTISKSNYCNNEWKTTEYQISVDITNFHIRKLRDSIVLSKILHEHLCNILSIGNALVGSFYGQLLFLVIYEQLSSLFRIFMVLKLYYIYGEMNALASFFTFSDFCFGYLGPFSLLLYIASLLKAQSSKTGDYIQQVYLTTRYKRPLMENLKLFALQNIQCRVKLTADDLYEIDWSNILMVLGEIMSYILFIIQYHLNMDRTL